MRAVERLLACSEEAVSPFEKVGQELAAAKLDYTGEETGTCELLTLEQILPALPPMGHGGSIKLMDLVSVATQEVLSSPHKLLKADFDQPRPKVPASVHFAKGEQDKICDELVRRGVCGWVKASEVISVRGVPVLNGLFGVKKPATLPDGRHTLRVIMNLKPSNSVLTQIRGAVEGLPAITSWQAAVLETDECFRFYQSDISSAFYLFELPECWMPFLCFDVCRRGEALGLDPSCSYFLSCRVLPMGFHSSVSLMQEVSETVLWRAGLAQCNQVRRGQPVPQSLLQAARRCCAEGRSFWQVYLDNFMGGDKRIQGESSSIGDQLHETVEATWKSHGILSAEKKRVSNTNEAEELGALLHGDLGVLGGSPKRFCKLVQSSLWLLAQKPLKKKTVQVVAGRWVHVIQFRRPGMSFLDKCWNFINKEGTDNTLALQTKREFFLVMGAIPLLHTCLNADIDKKIWCSDASERGGAVGYASELTPEGMDFVMSSRISSRTLGTSPILVVGLFSGIGGTFRIYDILDIIPRGCIAVDIHAPANRVVSRRWPSAKILRDVRAIARSDAQEWARDFYTVDEVHIWGGFPCRDLSSARAGRMNLQGSESGLFFEFIRIWNLVAEEFPARVKVKVVAENVASMDESASQEISEWMQCQPYFVDSVDSVPLRRPRLCWTTEVVEGCLEGLDFVPDRRWTTISAPCPYPEVGQWLTPGYSWPGQFQAGAFPTCMRAVWKENPPFKPAGLHRADQDCQARWALSGYIYPPYQFREEFLVWKNDKW